MKSPKFYKLIIVALIVLNIATLAFMWFGRPPHPPHGDKPPISGVLGIVGDAAEKVNKLEKEHHIEKKQLVHRDMDLHNQLYEAIGSGQEYVTLLDSISENKKEMEKMTFEFFNDVASHCNEDQKAELRKFVHGAFEQLRPRPRKD